MYQSQYSSKIKLSCNTVNKKISDFFVINEIRPTMWEEHCLECSAPTCFKTCTKYNRRIDGRCKRFEDGFNTYVSNDSNEKYTKVKFLPWSNMMTIIYPTYQSNIYEVNNQFKVHEKLLSLSVKLNSKISWPIIRAIEYHRRSRLKKYGERDYSDAFVLHVFSHHKEKFKLVMDVYNGSRSVYKKSFEILSGENLYLLSNSDYSKECDNPGNKIKIYPENDITAEIDFYLCDFVKGDINSSIHDDFVKCVVWDLDNTLWDGILIETDNPSDLKLKSEVLKVIEELDKRGIVQSIASKNDHEIAMPVLEALNLSKYFLYPQINWGPKSESIKYIAQKLNINTDTFAFIDDSSFERNQVRTELQEVRIFTDKDVVNLLLNKEFNVTITEESHIRREMYQAEMQRNEIREINNFGIIDFIRDSKLEIELFNPTEEQSINRCYDLLSRTNQLNASGIKYSKKDFLEMFNREKYVNIAVNCKDKYGNYGLTCYLQYSIEKEILSINEFAMSCRTAGKFVENALLYNILINNEIKQGVIRVIKAKKNVLLRNVLQDIKDNSIDINNFIMYEFSENIQHHNVVNCVK